MVNLKKKRDVIKSKSTKELESRYCNCDCIQYNALKKSSKVTFRKS